MLFATHHHSQGWTQLFSTETALHNNNNYYFKIKWVAETIQMWRYHHAQECIQWWFLTRIMRACMSDVWFWINPSDLLWPPSSLNKISGKALSPLHANQVLLMSGWRLWHSFPSWTQHYIGYVAWKVIHCWLDCAICSAKQKISLSDNY